MNNPARLHKREDNVSKLDKWLWANAHIILPILMVILLVLIIGLIWSIATMGGGNVTVTDSNNYYYHLKDVI